MRKLLQAQNNAIEHPRLTQFTQWGKRWAGKVTNKAGSQPNNEGMALSLGQTPADVSHLMRPRDPSELTPAPETPRMPPGYEGHVEYGIPYRGFPELDHRTAIEKIISAMKDGNVDLINSLTERNWDDIANDTTTTSRNAARTLSDTWQGALQDEAEGLTLTDKVIRGIDTWAEQHHALQPIEEAFLFAASEGRDEVITALQTHIDKLIPQKSRQHFILALAITRRANALDDVTNDSTLDALVKYGADPFDHEKMHERPIFKKTTFAKPGKRRAKAGNRPRRPRAPILEFKDNEKSAKEYFLLYDAAGNVTSAEENLSNLDKISYIIEIYRTRDRDVEQLDADTEESKAGPPTSAATTPDLTPAEKPRPRDDVPGAGTGLFDTSAEAQAPNIGEDKTPDDASAVASSKDGVGQEHAVPSPSSAKSIWAKISAIFQRNEKPSIRTPKPPPMKAVPPATPPSPSDAKMGSTALTAAQRESSSRAPSKTTKPVIRLDRVPKTKATGYNPFEEATSPADLYRATYNRMKKVYAENRTKPGTYPTVRFSQINYKPFQKNEINPAEASMIQAQACADFIAKTHNNKSAIPQVIIEVLHESKQSQQPRNRIGAVVNQHRRSHIVWLSGVIGLALISPTAHLMNVGLSAAMGTNLWFAAAALMVAQVAYVAYQVINNTQPTSNRHANNLGSAWDNPQDMGFEKQGHDYQFKAEPTNAQRARKYIENGQALVKDQQAATKAEDFASSTPTALGTPSQSPPASRSPSPRAG